MILILVLKQKRNK